MLKLHQYGLIETERQRRINGMTKSEKAMSVLIGFLYVLLAGGWIFSGIHYKSFAIMLMESSKIGIVYYVLPPIAIFLLAGSSLCELVKNKSTAMNAIFSIILSLAIFGTGGKYYWLGSNGVMRTGWQKVYNKKYYYLGGANDGAMKTGWQKIGRYWYWLGNDGDMKSGWQTIYKKKYYLGGPNDGAMKTGWQQIGGYWYYFGKSGESNEGVLRTNTWVDGYYVDGNGRWDKTKKIDVGDYLTGKKDMQLINILGLKRQSSGYGKTYAKGKITYYYVESGHTYGITNEGNQYVTIYGIVPGNSLSDIKRVLKPKNWKQAKENYKNNEGSPYLFIKEIGSRSYMIEVETNSYGIITQWYVMNWPQGEFMFPENLKDISVQASLDDSSTGVVLNAEESENLKTNTDGAQVSEQEENTTVEENTEEQETEPEVQEAETPEENVDEIETPENEDTDVDSEEIIEETEEVEE